jgi:hypothetical protein
MVVGPQSPFSNIPTVVEVAGDWICELLQESRKRDAAVVEADPASEEAWVRESEEIAYATLFAKEKRSWVFGTNVPGKRSSALFYLGGLGAYRQRLDDVAAGGYPGYLMR